MESFVVGNTTVSSPLITDEVKTQMQEEQQLIQEVTPETMPEITRTAEQDAAITSVRDAISLDDDNAILTYGVNEKNSLMDLTSKTLSQVRASDVGGGLTNGVYCGNLAFSAQENGAEAVVLNGPVDLTTVKAVRKSVDIPVIYTVIDKTRDLQPYVDSGVNIFNVSGGKDTIELVKWVREQYPDMIIIASGGKSDESILATIEAGADAITYTTYGKAEQYFQEKMESYRNH